MAQKDTTPPKLKKAVHVTERYIIKVLIAMMSVLLVIATIELGFEIIKAITIRDETESHLIINLDNLLNVFGVFLLVLIGIELLDTIKVYFKKHIIHVEVVMLVALIALSRKIIVMDYVKYTGLELLGIATIIVALAGGYFLIKKTGGCGFWPKESEETEDVIIKEKINQDDDSIIEREKIIKKHSGENLIAPSDLKNQQKESEKIKEERSRKKDND